MATRTSHEGAKVGTRSERMTAAVPENDGGSTGHRLTSEQVWQALAKTSFAVIS